jgi:hypothetical protein
VAPLLVLRFSLIGRAAGESDGPRRGTAEALGALASHRQREHPEVDWDTREGTDDG